MSLDDLIDTLNGRLTDLTGLDAKLAFDLGDDGMIAVDATQSPPVLTRDGGDDEADCTISLSLEDMQKLMTGNLNPMLAYTMGRLKVNGSLGIAMKLASRLED